MAWSTPYTATTGDLITASIWNTYIKNQQRYLKGLDGAVEIEDDLTVPNLITPGNVDGVDVGDHAANTTTAHGAVSAATASKHVVRDASARAKFAAPGASGDALIKGTRVTADELPAVTDEFYLVGTGGNVEERAVPVAATGALKTSDQTVNNSTTLVNVTQLLLPVGATDVWLVHLLIRHISASDTPDIDLAFTVPAGGSIISLTEMNLTSGVGGAIIDFTTEQRVPVTTTEKYRQLFAFYKGGGTAGNLQLQFAQGTATVEDTTIKENSFMMCQRIV